MKTVHHVIGALLFVLFAAMLLGLLWAGASGERWASFADWIASGRLPVLLLAVAGSCLLLLHAASARRDGGRDRYLSLDTEGGTVSISSGAIREYILKLSQEFPSVARMNPKVIPRRNSIDIRVDLKVRAGPNIHEICEMLQKRVRESLTAGLGISQIGRITIGVKNIVSEHRPAA